MKKLSLILALLLLLTACGTAGDSVVMSQPEPMSQTQPGDGWPYAYAEFLQSFDVEQGEAVYQFAIKD